MQYDELMVLVLNSEKDDWLSDDNVGIHTFKGNLNVRIVEERDEDDPEREFHESWANKFPDPYASRSFYCLFYGASLVERYLLVNVDGGRATLPLPDINTLDVTFERYAIARIVDRGGQFDEYIRRAGLKVESATRAHLPR